MADAAPLPKAKPTEIPSPAPESPTGWEGIKAAFSDPKSLLTDNGMLIGLGIGAAAGLIGGMGGGIVRALTAILALGAAGAVVGAAVNAAMGGGHAGGADRPDARKGGIARSMAITTEQERNLEKAGVNIVTVGKVADAAGGFTKVSDFTIETPGKGAPERITIQVETLNEGKATFSEVRLDGNPRTLKSTRALDLTKPGEARAVLEAAIAEVRKPASGSVPESSGPTPGNIPSPPKDKGQLRK